jgi:DNA polymerase-3 subunit delta'
VFERIPGQARAKELFARALRDDALSHAYLLAGPEGTGKVEAALEVAVALVAACGGCGHCSDCERARRGAHPDLHVIEREGDEIRSEQIAPVIEELALKPFAASRRVFVIPEVEYFNVPAGNKLLKSIEEPPAYVYFLLVTDRLEAVLPTIVSRCQLVEFTPVSDADVARYLAASCDVTGPRGEALARLARGSVERAARLAADAGGADRRGQYVRYAAEAVSGRGPRRDDAVRAFLTVLRGHLDEVREHSADRLAARLAELERQIPDERDRAWHVKHAEALARREERRVRRLASVDALDAAGSWLRDLWVVACGAPDVLWNSDRGEEHNAAAVASPDHYGRLLAAVAATRKDLYLNIDPGLALRAMFAGFEEVGERAQDR